MRLFALMLSLCGVLGWVAAGAAPAPAGDTAAPGAVALTVYGGGVGVVTGKRSLVLAPGRHHIIFDHVAPRLLPQTVSIDRPGLEVLAQRFVYDPPSRASLLKRFVGQKVLLFPKGTTDATAARPAWLLSSGGGAPVVRVDNRIETIDGDSPWRIAFPASVYQFSAAPFIAADVNVTASGHAPLMLSYLTQGLSWRLDYVARLDADAGRLVLTGLASIENHSGIGYTDARIRLVAGEPHRATATPAPVLMRAARAEAKSAASYAPATRSFEYYTYTLPRPYTLKADSNVQLPLIAAAALQVTREYRVESAVSPRPYTTGAEKPVHARVLLHGRNTLDRPLPAGTVRIFSDGGKGGRLWLGEDQLDALPAGQAFTLEAGRAFDVTATRTQTDFERLDDKRRAASWKVELHNAKPKAVTVRVVESLSGDWTIDKESEKHVAVDAQHVAWTLKVPAGGSQMLTYRVQWR